MASISLTFISILSFSSLLFLCGNGFPISYLVSEKLFNSIFLHKDDTACPAKDFYSYSSFIEASKRFPKFGNAGSLSTRRREIAAFLAQISHETTGGWATAPDGPYAWGLCFKEEVSPGSDYCDSTDKQWPCYAGKSYKGRVTLTSSFYYPFFILFVFFLGQLAI